AAARQWAAQLGIGVADTPAQLARFPAAYLTLARLKLAQRDEAGLPALLRRLADLGTALRSARFRLHVALLQAVLCARRGDVATASAHFGQALNLAETGGFVRLVLDYQEPALLRLLHLAAGGGATAGYARLLLGHLGLPGVETAVDPPPTLTPRELDVLHALAAGLANHDVAARLTVSVNTVKSHTRRLYDKLGVRSRAAAVARARALGLLDP
ncbi:MAG: hypothetical protein KC425_18810, partial [Anaerolineales bacterium]|nr:hypothetical protein [Anaerolineales bacterium]